MYGVAGSVPEEITQYEPNLGSGDRHAQVSSNRLFRTPSHGQRSARRGRPLASATDAGMFNTGTCGVNGRTMADIRTGQTGIAETPRTSPVSPSSSVSSTASAQEQAGLHNNGASGVNGLTAAEIRTGITQPRPMQDA